MIVNTLQDLLTFPVYRDWHFEWEMDLLTWINQNMHGVEWINNTFYGVTILCDIGLIWFLLGFIFLFFKKWRKTGVVMLITLIVVAGLNNFCIKIIGDRARPFYYNNIGNGLTSENMSYDLYLFVRKVFSINDGKGIPFLTIGEIPDKQSFMSGHTVSSFACATIIFLYHKKAGIFALVFAGLIAFSRMLLCVHWPTDILFGAIFAVGSAIGMYFLCNFVWKKIEEKHHQKLQKNSN